VEAVADSFENFALTGCLCSDYRAHVLRERELLSWSALNQTAFVRLTEHSFINRNQNHPSHAMRLWRSVAFVASVLLSVLVGIPCSGDDDSTPARARGKGRVTIVYQDDAIQPENRDAIKKIRDSGVFERMADRLTKAVALPYDLQVVVTDKPRELGNDRVSNQWSALTFRDCLERRD
jgi:hypothetical protein